MRFVGGQVPGTARIIALLAAPFKIWQMNKNATALARLAVLPALFAARRLTPFFVYPLYQANSFPSAASMSRRTTALLRLLSITA